MKTILITIVLLELSWMAQAQVYKSQDVMLSFFSKAPIEDIKAESKKGVSAVNFDTKSIYFKVCNPFVRISKKFDAGTF